MAQVSLTDPNLLSAALEGLQVQRDRINSQIAMIQALLNRRGPGRPPKAIAEAIAGVSAAAAPAAASASGATARKKRKPLSAAARKRIAAAQKARWDAYRKKQAAGE